MPEASKNLTLQLEQELKDKNLKYTRGTSWTVDAVYRETIEEASMFSGFQIRKLGAPSTHLKLIHF